jgi:hypothetical protein
MLNSGLVLFVADVFHPGSVLADEDFTDSDGIMVVVAAAPCSAFLPAETKQRRRVESPRFAGGGDAAITTSWSTPRSQNSCAFRS